MKEAVDTFAAIGQVGIPFEPLGGAFAEVSRKLLIIEGCNISIDTRTVNAATGIITNILLGHVAS